MKMRLFLIPVLASVGTLFLGGCVAYGTAHYENDGVKCTWEITQHNIDVMHMPIKTPAPDCRSPVPVTRVVQPTQMQHAPGQPGAYMPPPGPTYQTNSYSYQLPIAPVDAQLYTKDGTYYIYGWNGLKYDYIPCQPPAERSQQVAYTQQAQPQQVVYVQQPQVSPQIQLALNYGYRRR